MSRGTPFDSPGQLKSVGTPFDVPTQIRQSTPTNISSNSKDTVTEPETFTKDKFNTNNGNNSPDSVMIVTQESISTTPNEAQKSSSTLEQFVARERGSVDIGDTGNTLGSNNNEKITAQPVAWHYSSNPRVILSFTNDPVLTKLTNSDNFLHTDNSLSNDISVENDVGESHKVSTSKTYTSRDRRTSKRLNPSDNESESTLGQSEEFLKKPAKRHKRSNSIASVASTATDGSGVSCGSGSTTKKRKSFKTRRLNNKKRTKPWEDDPEEEIPHDDAVVTIAELCKDIKRGRKSSTFKELELAKYMKAHQRRAKRLKLDDLNECDENNPDDEAKKNSKEDSQQDSDHQEENFEADYNQENFDENDNYDDEYNEDGEGSEGDHEENDEYDQGINGEDLNVEEETNIESRSDKPIFMKRYGNYLNCKVPTVRNFRLELFT